MSELYNNIYLCKEYVALALEIVKSNISNKKLLTKMLMKEINKCVDKIDDIKRRLELKQTGGTMINDIKRKLEYIDQTITAIDIKQTYANLKNVFDALHEINISDIKNINYNDVLKSKEDEIIFLEKLVPRLDMIIQKYFPNK